MNLVNTANNLQNNQNTISEKVDKLISDLNVKKEPLVFKYDVNTPIHQSTINNDGYSEHIYYGKFIRY